MSRIFNKLVLASVVIATLVATSPSDASLIISNAINQTPLNKVDVYNGNIFPYVDSFSSPGKPGLISAEVGRASADETFTHGPSDFEWIYHQTLDRDDSIAGVNNDLFFTVTSDTTFTLTSTWDGPSMPGQINYGMFLWDYNVGGILGDSQHVLNHTGKLYAGRLYELNFGAHIETLQGARFTGAKSSGDFHFSIAPASSPRSAPEPSTCALLCVGGVVAAMGACRRRASVTAIV